MGLLSLFSKNKQEQPAADDGHFSSRAAEESNAVRNRNKRGAGRKSGATAREDEETLTEKKRARRRLVGAVALVLAVIIGLPMIFDSEPKPLASDIAIQIPAKDKAAPAPAPASAEAAASAATSTTTAVAAESAVPNPEGLDENEEIVEPAKGEAERAVAEVKADGKPLPIKPAAVKTGAADTAAAVAKTGAADNTAAAAKTGAVDKTAVLPKTGAADKTKAEAKADAASDAQRAAAILEGKPEPRSDAKPETKPEARPTEGKGGKFMIRVIALATPEKVDELRGKLGAAGIKSSTQKIVTQSGELTRVLVGPFATKEEAEKTREKLVKLGLSGQLASI